jgi:hypothetical protein
LFQTSKETKRIKAVYACLSKNDKLSSICQRIKEKKVASAQQLEHLSFFLVGKFYFGVTGPSENSFKNAKKDSC